MILFLTIFQAFFIQFPAFFPFVTEDLGLLIKTLVGFAVVLTDEPQSN